VNSPSTSDPADQSDGRPTLLKLIDSRIVGLTLMNVLLFWGWRWLRRTYDRGIDRPDLLIFLAAATLWVWWQLLTAIASWRRK
jgi:hypothetical protein